MNSKISFNLSVSECQENVILQASYKDVLNLYCTNEIKIYMIKRSFDDNLALISEIFDDFNGMLWR